MTSPADVHAAKLATIEAAADAEESLRERVARAMWEVDWSVAWPANASRLADDYRHLADAAIATICTPVEGAPAGCGAEAALRRVLALADELESWSVRWAERAETRSQAVAGAYRSAADRIRDAAGLTA